MGPSAHLGKVLCYQTMLQGLSDLPVSSTHVQPTHLLKATVRIFCLVVVFFKKHCLCYLDIICRIYDLHIFSPLL